MKIIFISRQLSAESLFRAQLEKDFQIHDESLIDFFPVEIGTIPDSDWLFFYSKNGVTFSWNNERLRAVMLQRKIAVLGEGTATQVRDYGLECDFVGNGNPEEVAALWSEEIGESAVLFLRANHSKMSVQHLLSDTIIQKDIVVYNNLPKSDFTIPMADILVFTSPLNVQTYFGKYELIPHQTLIAIGKTTAAVLHQFGFKQIIISKKASERGLVLAIGELED